MKIKRQNFVITLSILLITIMFFLPYQFIFSKAEEISAVADIDPTISATLYDTNQYASGTGVELTEEGAKVDGWQYDTSKFLQIDPLVPADGNKYIVTVKLPQELYIVGSELTTPSGYQNLEFTKNESLVINENTSYDLNTLSGSVEYTMNTMGVSGTIQLEIAYDIVLWDKMANSSLTPEGIEPIIVTLSKKDSTETVTEIKKISIGKATSKDMLQHATQNYWHQIEGEDRQTISNDIITTKDKKVIMYIHDMGATTGYIYKYHPKMILTINLPYYTDSSGVKHYIQMNTDVIEFTDAQYSSYKFDTSIQSEGIVTIEIENIYFMSELLGFSLGPLNEELLNIEEEEFLFQGGTITATVDGKNGSKNNAFISSQFTNLDEILYRKEEKFELINYKIIKNIINPVNRPQNTVSLLQCMCIGNAGNKNSCEKTIYNEFDIENTNWIKVTTMNIPCNNLQEYIDITYTLVDENGNRVYMDSEGNVVEEGTEGAIGEWIYTFKNNKYYHPVYAGRSNLFYTLTRNMLPENQRGYYFKSLKYVMSTIYASSNAYGVNVPKSNASGGN